MWVHVCTPIYTSYIYTSPTYMSTCEHTKKIVKNSLVFFFWYMCTRTVHVCTYFNRTPQGPTG